MTRHQSNLLTLLYESLNGLQESGVTFSYRDGVMRIKPEGSSVWTVVDFDAVNDNEWPNAE